MMIEIRGLELRKETGDIILSSIVTVNYPEDCEKKELLRNKPVNRGQILTALSKMYEVKPWQIVWPRHIKVPKV